MPTLKIKFYNYQTHETECYIMAKSVKEDFYLFFDPESPIVKNLIPKNWIVDSIVYYPDNKSLSYYCLGGE